MADNKIGVYLCEGCGIGESVSIDEIEAVATGEFKVPVCKKHAAFCSEEGLAQIKSDIDAGEVNKVVVGACSPRVMQDRFRFDNAEVMRANLREQVTWMMPSGEEDTQMAAADNVRMGIAQAMKSAPPQPHGEADKSEKLLIVGGGITGLTAAWEAANTGVEVTLVDKADKLGGWVAGFKNTIPFRPPYRGLQENKINELIEKVSGHDAITVKTNTIVAKTSGMPGKFDVTLKNGQGDEEGVFGAIVVATGWRPYDISQHEYLGYGKSDDIMTDCEFEELAFSGEIKRKSDGKKPGIVAFIIPADEERMPYSSGVSDKIAVKQALMVLEDNPDAMAYIIHDDFRCHGTSEEFYREAQEKGVVFQKAEVKSIEGDLTINAFDRLLNTEIPMSGLDMIVLSTGMVPNSTNPDIEAVEDENNWLKDDIDPLAPLDFVEEGAEGKSEEEIAESGGGHPDLPGGPVLNLQYRQGPHLPILAHGFSDSHYICFPYETRRTGIYTCGPVRRAMISSEAAQDAQGAVLKAIQAVRAAEHSEAVLPRVGDLSFPEFGLDICTKCKRCTVECPFGAIDESDETGYPVLNPSRCRRCGTCMGACPVRTISFKNYSPQMVSEMIGAVNIPDEFSEKPRILVLACENDAYPALDMAGINGKELNPYMRFIPVRCLGSITLLWVSTALEKGYDGVMLMGCKSGDDYQCHFIKGSGLARERMSKVGETLQSLMLEPERVRMEEVSIADSHKVTEMLNAFSDEIKAIGLNPFKGF